MGKDVNIKQSVNMKYTWKPTVGDNCWIGEQVWTDNLSEAILGSSVTLSPGALLLTGSHDHTKESFDFLSYPIIIEDEAWIGANAVVMGAATRMSHSILGCWRCGQQRLETLCHLQRKSRNGSFRKSYILVPNEHRIFKGLKHIKIFCGFLCHNLSWSNIALEVGSGQPAAMGNF